MEQEMRGEVNKDDEEGDWGKKMNGINFLQSRITKFICLNAIT